MYSTNLSKLMVNDYFFELIKEEKIHFDWIISDFHFEKPQNNFILFNDNLDTLLLENKIKKSDHICIILDQLPTSLLWSEIFWYENIIFICPFSGISSIGHKISQELNQITMFERQKVENWFPFDMQTLIKILKKDWLHALHLVNQEIAENIYEIQAEEELAIVDKALIDQPEEIHLINNPEAETLVIGLWNYFEELVKLSEYLLHQEERYHFLALACMGKLSSEEIKLQAKKAKKIILLLDQESSPELQNLITQKLNTQREKIRILSPLYTKLTTTLTDYQLEQTEFDAEHLAERIKNS